MNRITTATMTPQEIAAEVALGLRTGLLQQCSRCGTVNSFSPDYDHLGLPPAERPGAFGWYCRCGHWTSEGAPLSAEYRNRTAHLGRRHGGGR